MSDPKGNPLCLRESVDKVPTAAPDRRVRTRSAWEGSGNCGAAGPVLACRRLETLSLDDMEPNFLHFVLYRANLESFRGSQLSADRFIYGSLSCQRVHSHALPYIE
jgi:hypothetical protein